MIFIFKCVMFYFLFKCLHCLKYVFFLLFQVRKVRYVKRLIMGLRFWIFDVHPIIRIGFMVRLGRAGYMIWFTRAMPLCLMFCWWLYARGGIPRPAVFTCPWGRWPLIWMMSHVFCIFRLKGECWAIQRRCLGLMEQNWWWDT